MAVQVLMIILHMLKTDVHNIKLNYWKNTKENRKKNKQNILTRGGKMVIYTELTNKAMKIAYEAHTGQRDAGGLPYIFHPYHLAEQMDLSLIHI